MWEVHEDIATPGLSDKSVERARREEGNRSKRADRTLHNQLIIRLVLPELETARTRFLTGRRLPTRPARRPRRESAAERRWIRKR